MIIGAASAAPNNSTHNSTIQLNTTNTTVTIQNSTETLPDPQIWRNGAYNATYATLAEAINNTQNNDTILLENGGTFTPIGHGFTISKNLTFNVINNGKAYINGTKTTLTGPMFIISTGITVNIINIVFTNAPNTAILNNGTLTLTNCTFQNNEGSAILNNVNLTAKNCTFNSNDGNGGNGGAINNGGTSTLEHCIFLDNSASADASGGAIENGANTLTVENCTFTDNWAYAGGAIANIGNLNITANSTFKGNNAVIGGVIYNDGTLNITSSSFNNNYADNLGEVNYSNGGGIYNTGNMNVTGSNFISNNAIYGGAIDNKAGTSTINNSTFTDNTATPENGANATPEGGAIYNDDTGSLTVKNSTFTGNNATGNGGAINNDNSGDTLNVYYSTFNGNTANYGGAIDNDYTLSVTGCNFTNNKATKYGGAIGNDGTLTVTGSKFTNSTALDGGAISSGKILTVNNSTFNGNKATDSTTGYGGGAIFNTGTLTINGISTFTNNTVTNGHGSGGSINNYIGGNLTLNGSTFNGNTASDFGGAIENQGNSTLNSSNFTGNTAFDGGAIYNTGNLTITGITFTGNTVTDYSGGGGAIYNYGGVLNVTGCTFNRNNATAGFGGAILNYPECTLNVTNSTFNGNHALYGGAIENSLDCTLNITGSTFIGNNASDDGGAIDNSQYGNILINFSRIIGNTASSGNAISNFGGTVNASLNWWGSNANPSSQVFGNVTVTPWFVLTVTANPSIIQNNDNSTIKVDLQHDSNGIIHDPANGQIPDGIPMTFHTTLGSISNISPTINVSAQSTLNSGSKAGLAIVSVTVDNQIVNTNVLVLDTIPPTASANPAGGVFNFTQNVTLSMSEPGTIYYTTNGSTPTFNSNRYLSPIPIITNTKLEFFAMDLAGNTSPFYNDNYTILTVSANPVGGVFNSTRNVTLSMTEKGTIYYTTNGSTPTISSSQYTTPISIASTTTLKFFAKDLTGYTSLVYTNIYTILTVSANPASGVFNSTRNVTLSMSEPGTIYYTINGSTPTFNSNRYLNPIPISTTTTLKFFAIDLTGITSIVYTDNYTVSPKVTLTNPVNNTVNIPINQIFTLNFTEPITAGSAYANIVLKNSSGTVIPINKSINGNVLSITLSSGTYTKGVTYNLTLPVNSVKDLADNQLNTAYSVIFTITKT
jgi:predicted outer membrane repeat protein